jgi:hypothetical protein
MYIITILVILTCDSVGYKGNMFKFYTSSLRTAVLIKEKLKVNYL